MDHNNNRFSFAATWCDYNGDGWPDLYVTNDFGRKNLYRNDRGHFRDVAEEAGVVDLGPGMSAAWLDYDGDGHPDLLVSNMWSSSGQRIVNDAAFGPARKDPSLREAYRRHVKGNSLYRNNGDGSFTYTGDSQGIEIGPWSWSCDGFDFDNDGSPEFYIACGMLNNGGQTDLMSYFYRQVVAKSPVTYMAAPEYENGWNAINQLIRQDYSWASPEPQSVFRAEGRTLLQFFGRERRSTWRKTAARLRLQISMATGILTSYSRAGWLRRYGSSRMHAGWGEIPLSSRCVEQNRTAMPSARAWKSMGR